MTHNELEKELKQLEIRHYELKQELDSIEERQQQIEDIQMQMLEEEGEEGEDPFWR